MHFLLTRRILPTLLTAPLLALTLAACTGGSDAPRSRPTPTNLPRDRGDDSTTGEGLGGYVRGPHALVCTDGKADVTGSKAPAWADLRSVGWERDAFGAMLSYHLAAPVPLAGTAEFTAGFAKGADHVQVTITLRDAHWTVTAAGKKIDAPVQSVNRDVFLQLPRTLGPLDLADRLTVTAASRGRTFTDPVCDSGVLWRT